MKTIEANVYMLPAEGLGVLLKGVYPEGNEPLEILPTDDKEWLMFGKPQHLYITTDEEIKEGDWFYNSNMNRVAKCSRSTVLCDAYYKIIATTDPKLIVVGVAKIEQYFIEEYCKAGGIDKVLVECKRIPHFDIEYSHGGLRTEKFNGVTYEDTNEPKLNPDNTIIIHPAEEKMYSLDDIRNAYDVGRNYQRTGDIDLHFDNWIKSIS